MAKESLLDWISQPGFSESHTRWANGKLGSICDPEDNCIYRFIELSDDGKYYKYGCEDRQTKSPYIAYGIIAWWLKYRRQKKIAELYETYYQMRLNQYREQRERQADSWKIEIEDEFLNDYHVKFENDLIKRSEAIYDYLPDDERKIVHDIANNYLQYIENKLSSSMNTETKYMLSQNEIITLVYLSDGHDHSDPPKGLTVNQFYAALKNLQSKEMVSATFLIGEVVQSSHIRARGKAALDDLRVIAKEKIDKEIKIKGFGKMKQDIELTDFEVLLEENLFQEWADLLCETNSMFGNNDTASYIWSRAKHYAIGIADSKKPVLKFKNRCHEIRNEFNFDPMDTQYILSGNPYEHVYSIVVGCVYTMIVFSAEKKIAQQIINEIPVYGVVPYCAVQNVVHAIVDKITKGEINCDYDYTKENGEEESDIDGDYLSETESNMQSQLKEKDEEIQHLKEELAIYQQAPISDDPRDKVRLEVFCKLLEESGVDFDVYGTKAEAARLAEYITGLPKSTCKNYMTNRDLNTTEHSDEVLKTNTSIKKIGIEWHL